MATPSAETPEYCPICRTLPLETIKFGVKGGGPQLDYFLEPNTFAQIHESLDEQFSKQCSIWQLAKLYSRTWSGEPLPPPHPDNGLPSLSYACGKAKNEIWVLIDPGTPIGRPRIWRKV
jgi:hypothetical protein